jgi:prepilin signal peptidase PulO-like enzyme (type II secretory pathway)
MIVWIAAGLVSGLLINYLADVLPATRRLSRPLWTQGPFTHYLAKPRVSLVLGLAIGAAILLYRYPPLNFPILQLSVVLLFFAAVTVIDIEHRVVMHPVSIVGALALGAIGVARHGVTSTLIGGAVGFGLMLGLYFLGDWLGRAMAAMRKEPWEETALGFGDVNLAGVIGLLMGWPAVIVALFSGMLVAGVYSMGYLIVTWLQRKYSAFASIPYAPFLCIGTLALVLISIYR